MTSPPPLEERVTHLEIILTHLEKRLETVSDVLLETNGRVDALERQLRAMADRHRDLEGRLQEPRDPLAEKPPHY